MDDIKMDLIQTQYEDGLTRFKAGASGGLMTQNRDQGRIDDSEAGPVAN
jgi:hypothetical protein